MRKLFPVLCLFFSSASFSQKVLVRGTAFDTTMGKMKVWVVVNDTLNKHSRLLSADDADLKASIKRYEQHEALMKDTNYVVRTKEDGSFRLQAAPDDSLYFYGIRHLPQVFAVKDLLKRNVITIQLQPQECIPYVACKDTVPSQVFAFVGEKLKVVPNEPFFCNSSLIAFDSRFKAEYRVIQQLYGHYSLDTIRFTVYDHYGRPAFSQYPYVLLFVSEYCGELYHEKYQFFEVFKTVDGRWASPGDPYRYDTYHQKGVRAQAIRFADSVAFDVSRYHENYIKRQYPAPYYKIEGSKAIPVMGAYVDDLLLVKKQGVLKARKIVLE